VTAIPVCAAAGTGVLVVHGIGVQEPGETRDLYGGAIERMWIEFGADSGSYSSSRCRAGHIHLVGSDDKPVAIVDEAYWDDLITRPPPVWKLLWWLLMSGPVVLLYTLTRPPRVHSGTFRRWRAMAGWLIRAMSCLPLVGLFQILAVVGVLGAWAVRGAEASQQILRVLALTLGDALSFVTDGEIADELQQRLIDRARQMGEVSDRLLVVAHSQGGAVAFEATTSGVWPTLPTEVVTLGSGHKRLTLLRWAFGNLFKRILLASGSFLLTVAGVASFRPAWIAISGDENAQPEAIGRLVGVSLPLGAVVLGASWLSGRIVARRIGTHVNSWTDIWATHDLVPDGTPSGAGVNSIKVHNARSIIVDHTTYHRNAPEVIAAIVDRIDPHRLESDVAALESLRHQRRRRLQPSGLGSMFNYVRIWKREDASDETISTEFRGRT